VTPPQTVAVALTKINKCNIEHLALS